MEYLDGWLAKRFPFWTIYDLAGTNTPHNDRGNDFWLDQYFVNKYGCYVFRPDFIMSIKYGSTKFPDTVMSIEPVFDDPTIENYIDTFMLRVESLSIANEYKYNNLYKTTLLQYDLLTEGAGKSIETWNGSYTETRTPDLINENIKQPIKNTSTGVNETSAMDSGIYQPNNKQTITDEWGLVSFTNTQRGTEKLEHNEGNRQKVITGNVNWNIPDLITKQREISLLSLYDEIFKDISLEILEYEGGIQ